MILCQKFPLLQDVTKSNLEERVGDEFGDRASGRTEQMR